MNKMKHILFLFSLLIGLGLASCGKFEPLTPQAGNEFENTQKAGVNDPNDDEDEEDNGSINDADEDEDEEKGGKPDSINDEDEDQDEAGATKRL